MTNQDTITMETSKDEAIEWFECFQMPSAPREKETVDAKKIREEIAKRSNERMQLLDSIESEWSEIATCDAEEKEKEIRFLGLKQTLFDRVYYELSFAQNGKELRGGINVLVGLLYDQEEGKPKDERYSIMGLWQRSITSKEQAAMAQTDILYSAECIKRLRQILMTMYRKDADYEDDLQSDCGEQEEEDEAAYSEGEQAEEVPWKFYGEIIDPKPICC